MLLDGRRIMRAEGLGSAAPKDKRRKPQFVCLCCYLDILFHHKACLADAMPAGKQVVVRPVLDNMPNVHCWSVGGSDGSHSMRLDTLDEGQTRLLACAPTSLSQPGQFLAWDCVHYRGYARHMLI